MVAERFKNTGEQFDWYIDWCVRENEYRSYYRPTITTILFYEEGQVHTLVKEAFVRKIKPFVEDLKEQAEVFSEAVQDHLTARGKGNLFVGSFIGTPKALEGSGRKFARIYLEPKQHED